VLSFSFEVGVRQGRVTLAYKSLRGVRAPNSGQEMVRGLSLARFPFCFVFCNHEFIVLGTKSLVQRELWRQQNL